MNDIISWDKAIGRKVKSSDEKDLGRIQSITHDYIQTREGTISKNYYFIPKYYMSGFDGDNLYTSLTKSDVNDRFERDSPQSPSEFQTSAHRERIRSREENYLQSFHGIPWVAKELSTEIPVDYSGTDYDVPWDQLIQRPVRTADNIEVGYVERVGSEFVVVRERVSDAYIYCVPKAYMREYDGGQLWIDVSSGLFRSRFARQSEPDIEELRALARDAPRFKRAAGPEPDSATVETR
ncbi:MAG TPA: hypothetical protein VNI77_02155 [Nitrososphaera sp.]|nr:hypothetical protein [Nitrososphaera sp.]